MLLLASLSLLAAAPLAGDTVRADAPASTVVAVVVADTTARAPTSQELHRLLLSLPAGVLAPLDTERVVAIEYGEWYGRRASIHRWASYATLPLFAIEYAAGHQLIEHPGDAPTWARRVHAPVGGAIFGLFAVNTVTGVWNLWEGRRDPAGRGWRTAHSVILLVADAGFVATGALANGAEGSPSGRRRHRDVAISSMAVATVGYAMMLSPFRRD